MQKLILTLALGLAVSPLTAIAQTSGADTSRAALPTYIITFAEPGLLYNDGQRSGFAPTSPSSTGTRKLNARTPAAQAWRTFLANQQDNYIAQMEALVSRDLTPKFRYDVTLNGIALELSAQEATRIRAIPGVVAVDQEQIYEMHTDAGPAFIGAPTLWNGTQAPLPSMATRGQGVLVGVFDSGANPDHPSFANDASCGFSAGNPKLVAFKDCNTTNCATGNGEDVSFFVDTTNTGSSGHGVHTSSTVLGVPVPAGTLSGPAPGVPAQFNISGVAPCAKLISYKVCGTTAASGTAGCAGAAIANAIQTSIVDQIDVMNFSISGGTSPWTDNDRGFLDMVNADILVVASAGNTNTTITNPVGAVNHRGPWVLTVANSTHDRIITNTVNVAGGPQNVPGQPSNGQAYTATTTAQVASAAALGNEFGCTASGGFAAGSMTGKIALIKRGPLPPGTACGFTEKINNAQTAGAIAVVIYNHSPGFPGIMSVTGSTLPAIQIRQSQGEAIRDFIGTNPTAQMTVVAPAARVIDPSVADVLNSSSLRGPNPTVQVTKPDITAPGTNIYAASSDNFGQYTFLTGTSMSGPHVAGSGTLLRSMFPNWTVQEVKSALQLTATLGGRKEDETTPWNVDDVGNGRVDLTRAARTGLVMNETFANFLAANGNVTAIRALNIPSMRATGATGTIQFTRTFRNARGIAATYTAFTTAPPGTSVTVTPPSFTFGTSTAETQTVQISVTINQAIAAEAYGYVGFTPTAINGVGIVFTHGFEDTPNTLVPANLTLTISGNP